MSAPTLQDVMGAAGFSDSDVEKVRAGQLVSDTTPAATDNEIAARFAFRLKVPLSRIKKKYIDSPPRPDIDPDLREMMLIKTDEDIQQVSIEPNLDATCAAYLLAAPGSDFNLSQKEIRAFQSLHNNKLKVNPLLRKILTIRYHTYKRNGLGGIPPYVRRGDIDYHPGKELRERTERSLLMRVMCPEFYRYLIDYPNSKPDGVEESFFWANDVIDNKPTISLIQHITLSKHSVLLFCERVFYVSRHYNCSQGFGIAFADGPESVVVYVQRISTDEVGGYGSEAKSAIGSRIMVGKLANNLIRLQELAAKGDL